jgi:hypothetical protein
MGAAILSTNMKNASRSFPRPRRSASAAQALRAEMERVKKMTIQERVEECLSLRHKHPWLNMNQQELPSLKNGK